MATVAAVSGTVGASAIGTAASGGTNFISGITDFAKATIRITNALTVATTITLKAGTGFSSIGQGDSTAITLGTAAATNGTVVIGGAAFESARYLRSDGFVAFVIATAGDTLVSAVQLP
jgi:hypothetical protein